MSIAIYIFALVVSFLAGCLVGILALFWGTKC